MSYTRVVQKWVDFSKDYTRVICFATCETVFDKVQNETYSKKYNSVTPNNTLLVM